MISYAAIGGKSKVVNFVTFSSSMSFEKTGVLTPDPYTISASKQKMYNMDEEWEISSITAKVIKPDGLVDKTVRISTGERKTFSDLVSGSSYYNTLDVRVWINGMTSYDQDLSYSVTAD